MAWTKEQLANHKKASKLLSKIKEETFEYIRNGKSISEYETSQFIMKRFAHYHLKTHDSPIAAFRQNTGYVHYFPSQYCLKMKPESLILLDLWAKLNKKDAPYADLTFMAYYGKKIPTKVQSAFKTVIKARDEAMAGLRAGLKKKCLPAGIDVDAIARKIIDETELKGKFLHSLGHTLGTRNAHGPKNHFSPKNKKRIRTGIGYTIEPGVYLENKFGIRSEINIIIADSGRVELTSEKQDRIYMINF